MGQSRWDQESKHREPMGFCAPCFFPWVPSALHVVGTDSIWPMMMRPSRAEAKGNFIHSDFLGHVPPPWS